MRIIKLGLLPEAVVRAALFIDGTGGPPRENVKISINGGIIRHILPACGSAPLPGNNSDYSARDVTEIDCSNLTILPGLVDCHVHLALDGEDFNRSLERWDDGEALSEHLAVSLENTLNTGILAVRDGGDRRMIGLRASHVTAAPPFIVATGGALRKKSLYGSFLGKGLAAPDIKSAVREAAAAGAAQIKVLVSGIVSFREYGKVGPPQFSPEELTLLVDEAHHLGLRVMAHASSGEGTAIAVQCGVDSLEHGFFISEDTLARMAERGTAWVPTIIPVAAQTRKPFMHFYNPSQLAIIEKTYRRQQLMVEIAHRLGVAIGVGTDAGASGVRHGLSYIEELKLLVEAGLSPAEAIHAATAEGAEILGLKKQLGPVAPGKPAFLIGVRGNPLEDIDNLKKTDTLFIP